MGLVFSTNCIKSQVAVSVDGDVIASTIVDFVVAVNTLNSNVIGYTAKGGAIDIVPEPRHLTKCQRITVHPRQVIKACVCNNFLIPDTESVSGIKFEPISTLFKSKFKVCVRNKF